MDAGRVQGEGAREDWSAECRHREGMGERGDNGASAQDRPQTAPGVPDSAKLLVTPRHVATTEGSSR